MAELWIKVEGELITELMVDGQRATLGKPVNHQDVVRLIEAYNFLKDLKLDFTEVPEKSKAYQSELGDKVSATLKSECEEELEEEPPAETPPEVEEKQQATIPPVEKESKLFIDLTAEEKDQAILNAFRKDEKLTARKIARRINEEQGVKVDPRGLSRPLKKLVDRGLLEREKKRQDKYPPIYIYSKKSSQEVVKEVFEEVVSESPQTASPPIEEIKMGLSPEEETVLQELYIEGQVWDDEISKETRKLYRQLEEKGLLRASVTTWDDGKKKCRRAFWTLTERGISRTINPCIFVEEG